MQNQRTSTVLRLGMVVLCACGAWISGELLREHAGPWPSLEPAQGRQSLFARLCGTGANGKPGCAAVLESNFSAVDFDVPVLTRELTIRRVRVVMPVAFIGLSYFVFLGVWYALAGSPQSWGRWWRYVPLIVVLGGALSSVAFLWVMIFKLESRCLWCVVTHVINGLLLMGTLRLWLRKTSTTVSVGVARTHMPTALTRWAAFRVVGFATLVILGLWVYRGAKLDVRQEAAKLLPYKQFVVERLSDPDFLLREYFAEPQRAISLRDGDSGGGSVASAREPTVVIFGDFQCTHCACFASQWESDLRPHWNGNLRVSFRHFPLDQACNNTVKGQIHAQACEASYASEAARLQGGEAAFWQMHDLLFARSRRLGETRYADLAGKIGLDAELLLADMRSETIRQAVASDIGLAADLGVTGTPKVFLNGRLVPKICLYNPIFWEAVSSELQRLATLAEGSERDERGLDVPGSRSMASIVRIDP
ncbi:MAG: DsbA family protein [Planctomycetes bacterium]|nr:DsbA family protein [Planctomycetota bacterium]